MPGPFAAPFSLHRSGMITRFRRKDPTMRKSILLLFCVTAVMAQSPRATHSHSYPGRTGLALIALAPDGFALATDGAQFNADGTVSEVKKIFPIGKTGAVVLAGEISVQDPVTRPVREEFNAARIAELWLNAHPGASFESASHGLETAISGSASHFFADRRRNAGKYSLTLIFVSYAAGTPALTGERYFIPTEAGKPMRTESIKASPVSGEIWMLGLVKVPQELLTGNSAALNAYKTEPAIAKVRSSKDRASTQDYLAAFEVMLRAAEFRKARESDRGSARIGAPNWLASITAKEGFSLK